MNIRRLVAACAALTVAGCSSDEGAPVVWTTSPIATPTSSAAARPRTTFSDGQYLVGTDVAAGTYSTTGPSHGICAWSFLPRKGAGLEEAAGGNTIFGPGYMSLDVGQVVQVAGCEWSIT